MNLKELSWNELNKQGLIPGPEETEAEFIHRAKFCQNLLNELKERTDSDFPFNLSETISADVTEYAFHFSNKLYGISPKWVPIFFDNYKLSTWHGGCAWIFQLNPHTPTSAFLQLRKIFKSKSWYLGIYNRKELIAHELAHVGRMLYQEPIFEEILAYRSSESNFRRFFGPIVQSSTESLFFTIVVGLVLITSLILIFIPTPFAMTFILWLLAIPFLLVTLATIRLCKRQFQFNSCLKKLKKVYQSRQIAKHLIYRLTDKEICLFAKMKIPEVANYIHLHRLSSFRWQFLSHNYPLATHNFVT